MKLHTGIITVAAAATLAIAGMASAGSKFTGNGSVVVRKNTDGSGNATGLLGHVYNGTGKIEYIGCQKFVTGGAFCHARSEASVHVSCSTTSAYLGNAIGTLSPDARLTFRFNASGKCTAISITHSSEYQDKQG